jgi:hypothetical protein
VYPRLGNFDAEMRSNQISKVYLMTYSTSLGQLLIWISIAFCVTQSAVFSGLNLAIFSVSKLRLEVEAASGNLDALRVLDFAQGLQFHFVHDRLGQCCNQCTSHAAIGFSPDRSWSIFVLYLRHHRIWRYSSASLFFAQRVENGSKAHASARCL